MDMNERLIQKLPLRGYKINKYLIIWQRRRF